MSLGDDIIRLSYNFRFIYIARTKVKEKVTLEREEGTVLSQDPENSYPIVMYVNRVGLYVTAHAHILAALSDFI